MISTRYRLAILATAAVALAACGSSNSSSSNTTAAAGAAPTAAATTAAPATTAAAATTAAPATTAAATTTTAAPTSGASVSLATVGSFGSALVDAKGMSLYLFTNDSAGKSACSGACATNWPPAVATGTPTGGTGVDASKLSTITRDDGTMQLAYNGHPLYTFAADSAPGQASGQGVNGVWFLVNAAGDQVAGGIPGY
jgi:predicted lipoprotein with Yx(FWY)xxD motif